MANPNGPNPLAPPVKPNATPPSKLHDPSGQLPDRPPLKSNAPPPPTQDQDPTSHFTPGSISTPPPVPGGADHPGKGSTAVNTEAMKTFAKNLLSLVDTDSPVAKVRSELAQINIHPGGFHTAVNLATQINSGSSSGLADGTATAVGQIIEAVTSLADAVNKIGNHYDSIEAVNKMTADQYNSYMALANGEIGQLSGAGSGGSGSGSGGGSGSGSSSDGGSGSGSSSHG